MSQREKGGSGSGPPPENLNQVENITLKKKRKTMYIRSELEIPIPPSHLADRHDQDDWDKMISDATFYFLVADQKKALIKVESCSTH